MKEVKKSEKGSIKKIVRVSTGISALDSIIEGGFEKNSINIVIGGGGSGKSIFGVHFLVEGAKEGEGVLYISFEEKKEEFFINLEKVGFPLSDLEKKGKFIFVEYTPEKVKTMLEEGGGIIESLILKKKISRIVIDSLNSFILLFENEFKQREATYTLFNLLRGWKCTTILIYEENLPVRDKLISRILEFESDSTTLLYFIRDGNERKRYLEIFKMRGTDHSKGIHEFDIKKGGIVLNKKPFEGKLNI